MSNMESLEKQLASQKDEHKTDIHNLEMKALLEKRRQVWATDFYDHSNNIIIAL